MKRVGVGIIGVGFSAELHARGLRAASGLDVHVVAVAARSAERAKAFADRHRVPKWFSHYDELLADDEVEVVCVCVPNEMHTEVVVAAARAKKHVICEKPLTGAFGSGGAHDSVGRARDEWERARSSVEQIRSAISAAGVLFMYAENWIYAPAMTKVTSLLAQSDAPILDLRAEESHSGSHAQRSRRRATAGGGSLMMLGSHALAAVLHLKAFDGARRGMPIRPIAVTADTSAFENTGRGSHQSRLVEDWDDVERWANVVVRFDDDSRAVVTASFAMLGGMRNQFEVFTTESAFRANMTPNDGLLAFAADEATFGTEHLQEKLEARTGWIHASPDEDWTRGYPQEMQEFAECVAESRAPVSGLELAADVTDLIYASYLSAAEGRRIDLLR